MNKFFKLFTRTKHMEQRIHLITIINIDIFIKDGKFEISNTFIKHREIAYIIAWSVIAIIVKVFIL